MATGKVWNLYVLIKVKTELRPAVRNLAELTSRSMPRWLPPFRHIELLGRLASRENGLQKHEDGP